jgi:glycosyltransferase EpsF
MIKPKRILHVFGGMNRGGAETFIMNVYRKLDKDKVQFDFLVHSRMECDYDKEIKEMGGKIFILPKPSIRKTSMYLTELENILRDKGPFAAVHSHIHLFSGLILKQAQKSNIPIRISHSHTDQDGKNSSINRWIYRIVMRKLIIDNATHLLGCSLQANQSLYGNIVRYDKRVELVANAIDIYNYTDSLYEKHKIRKEFKLHDASLVLGHVGGFREVKNHRFLIEIFSDLLQKYPNAKLVLVGDGALREEIFEEVCVLGIEDNVVFLGSRSDVPRIMTTFDVFLLPSLFEGIPLVLIEAQAKGIPILASDKVNKKVDLELGLINFCSLSSTPEDWNIEIEKIITFQRPSWALRKKALREKKYDVMIAVKQLTEIYTK